MHTHLKKRGASSYMFRVQSVLGSADVGVQFRLYKNGSADQPLQRVGLSQDALEKAISLLLALLILAA